MDNGIWISMRIDHSIIYSHGRFIKKDSQCKQEYKSNPKPVDSINYPHQIPNHPERPKTLTFGKRDCTTCADLWLPRQYSWALTPECLTPLQLSAGKLIKKSIISQSTNLYQFIEHLGNGELHRKSSPDQTQPCFVWRSLSEIARLQAYEKQQASQDIHFYAEKEGNMCLFKYNSVWIP